jgi:anti-sigma regulatory factor (Ser/Thr protein kinase)
MKYSLKNILMFILRLLNKLVSFCEQKFNPFDEKFRSNIKISSNTAIFLVSLHLFGYPNEFYSKGNLVFVLKLSCILLGGGILIFRYLKFNILRRLFHTYWNIALIYCLPFATTVLLIVLNFEVQSLVLALIGLFFAMIILDLATFLVIYLIGVVLGLLFCYIFVHERFNFYDLTSFIFFYYLIVDLGLIFSVAYFFVKKKADYVNYKVFTVSLMASSFGHEIKGNMHHITSASYLINKIHSTGRSKQIVYSGMNGWFIPSKYYDYIIELYNKTQLINKVNNRIIGSFINSIKYFTLHTLLVKISMSEALEGAIENYYAEREVGDVHLKLNLENNFYFMGDTSSMNYLIFNLLDNSKKHGNAKEVSIWLDNSDKYYNKLHIRDDGTGISEANLKSIFNLFFTTKEGQGGTGVGLSLCKHVVEDFNGTISCLSKQGEGAYTEFIISLPKI